MKSKTSYIFILQLFLFFSFDIIVPSAELYSKNLNLSETNIILSETVDLRDTTFNFYVIQDTGWQKSPYYIAYFYSGIELMQTLTLNYNNSTSSIDSTIKYLRDYDLSGNLIEELTLNFTPEHYWRWNNGTRIKYEYDSKQRCIVKYNQEWIEEVPYSSWKNKQKTSSWISDDGKTRADTSYFGKDSLWVKRSYSYQTYDSHGTLLSSTGYDWKNNVWKFSSKNRQPSTYDSLGHLTGNTFQSSYTTDDTSWVTQGRQTCLYHDSDNSVEIYYENYVINDSSWRKSSKYISKYDNRNNLISEIEQYFENDIWKNRTRFDHVYKSVISVNEEQSETKKIDFLISPNPVRDYISIYGLNTDNFKISIINCLGICLLTAENTSFVDVSSLPSGSYFLVCDTKGRKQIKQFIVVK